MLAFPLFTALLWLLPAVRAQAAAGLGPTKVRVQTTSFNRGPSTPRGSIADAKLGEDVSVLAYEGNCAKVKRGDGSEAYIAKSALIPSEKYVRGPANEKEMGQMKAQGYEAGRFDPATEASYRKEKG